MIFKKIQIRTNNLRYKIAQFILRALYGHKNMYISPWKHTAATVDGIYIYQGKLLIAERSGNIEHAGKWHIPGGHIDMERNESILDTLKRETFEEHGFHIDISKINVNKPYITTLNHNNSYIMQTDTSILGLQYVYELSKQEMENVKTSAEAKTFKFANVAEMKKMNELGILIHDFSYIYPLLK